jgi:hypothetical protein
MPIFANTAKFPCPLDKHECEWKTTYNDHFLALTC